jgi:phage terminase small subunit
MGRPRIPEELKKRQGTFRPCRNLGGVSDFHLASTETNPPDYLNEAATEKWFELLEKLIPFEFLAVTDLDMLALYCCTYSEFIKNTGGKNSLEILKEMRMQLTSLGITPTTRKSIGMNNL